MVHITPEKKINTASVAVNISQAPFFWYALHLPGDEATQVLDLFVVALPRILEATQRHYALRYMLFGLPTEYISKPLLLSYWLHLGFPEKARLISSTISPASPNQHCAKQ